jgi:hypothetical protein
MAKKRKKGLSLASKIARQTTQVIKQKSLESHRAPNIVKGNVIKNYASDGALALVRLRALPAQESLHGLGNLLSERELRNKAIDYTFPKTLEIADRTHYGFTDKGIGFDISFEAKILKSFGSEISEFIGLKSEFENSLLRSELKRSHEILEIIFTKFGYSNWYVSSLLNLLYEEGKFLEIIEYNKNVVKEFDEKKYNPIAKVPLAYSGARCEKGISFERFEFAVQNQAEEFRLSKNFSRTQTLEFANLFSPDVDFHYMSDLLISNSTNNIIDRYLGFRRILTSCTLQKVDIRGAGACLNEVAEIVEDGVLNNILALLNLRSITANENDKKLVLICDLYVRGLYEDVAEYCEEILIETPTFTSCIEIYIKSLMRVGRTPKMKNLLGNLINKIIIIYKERQNNNVIKEIKKDFLRLSHCDWAYFIRLHYEKFSQCTSNQRIERYYLFLDLQCSLFNPFSKNCIDFKKHNKEQKSNLSYLLLHGSNLLDERLKIVADDRLLKVEADTLFNSESYEKAAIKYNKLGKTEDILFKSDALAKVVSCYFNMGEQETSITILSELIIEHGNAAQLPINSIGEYIISCEEEYEVSELTERAIVLYVYNQTPHENRNILSLICEDIFDKKGIDNFETINILDEAKDLFLFSTILKEDVIESFDMFGSLEEVYIFRIMIIQELLVKETPLINKVELKNELFKVFEKLVKEKCLVECGLGRIEVDAYSIRNLQSQQFEESIELIKSFEWQPISKDDFVDVEYLSQDYTVSKNDFFNKTLDFYYKIRDEYSLNPIFGLDNFLNMNIRHGGIVNLLWSPIKKFKLAFLKNEKGFYEREEYWFEQYPLLTAPNKVLLAEAFETFSKSVDNHILKAKSWLHINTGEFNSDEKLFNFLTDADVVVNLCESIKKNSSVDLILDEVFANLNSATNESLELIHKKIQEELSVNLIAAFEELVANTQRISKFDELNRKIRLAQVELSEKLSELISWLDWKKEASQNFEFNLSIEAAKDMAESLHPNYPIKLNIENSINDLIKGEAFRKFTTIFLILIDNAVIHSGQKGEVSINVEIENMKSGRTKLIVTNAIQTEDVNNLMCKVTDINKKVNQDYILQANEEKGSGLFKIKKLLTNGLYIDNWMEIFQKESIYGISIDIDLRSLYEE